ncbi:MAG: NADP-dependent oxidoreductase [Lautropia sp.]
MTGPLPRVNRQYVMAQRPQGEVSERDFAIREVPMPEPKAGEMLVRAHYLSADPLQRYRMEPTSGYGKVLADGEPLKGRMVGRIVQSRHPGYREGEFVEGMLGWQEYALSDGSTGRAEYAPGISRVDPSIAPITTSLGILGMPGVTAYFALRDICAPKAGETVVVSSAAGPVGSLAGQIAKLMGARVVGIAGSDLKVAALTDELGFDAGINHRTVPDMLAALQAACPDRIDAYFDNVGGEISDAVIQHLAWHARIAIVGDISRVNSATRPPRLDYQQYVMMARAHMKGFIVYDYEDRADEARREIATWIREGRIRYHESIVDGFENAPRAFIAMMRGDSIGKQLVRLVAD